MTSLLWHPHDIAIDGRRVAIYDTASQGGKPLLLWGHGWGMNAAGFRPLVDEVGKDYRHVLIDFPGFGGSENPPAAWGVADYAAATAHALAQLQLPPARAWIGHSFGCRVGVHMAAKKLWPLEQLVLIAAPGLPYPRPLPQRVRLMTRRWLWRAAKLLPLTEAMRDWARQKLGSADYRAAGDLRATLVKVLADDMAPLVRGLGVPVNLIYGEADIETPPAIGRAFARLYPPAQLHLLPGYDHHTVLTDGRFHVARLLRKLTTS